MNLLYYGDNLDVLRRHVEDESVTVGELLGGQKLDIPPVRQTSVTYKRAPRARSKAAEQPPLYTSDDEPV